MTSSSPSLRHRGCAERRRRRNPAEWAQSVPREPLAWPSAMAAIRCLRSRRGEHCRGARGRNLFGLALHSLSVGQRCAAGPGDRRKLMSDAEARALEHGCHSAWVDTFSFQAPGFDPSSAMLCLANWTIRPDTSAFFCRSGSWAGYEALTHHRHQLTCWTVADLSLALARTTSFRMIAVIATRGFLPAWTRRS